MVFLTICLIIIICTFIGIYNSFIRLKKRAMNSKSGIDVFLQQRFDLIPNLVEVTKGYMKHEKEVLEKVTMLRNEYNTTKDMHAVNELNNQYHSIMAVIESYPDLKANEQFLKLQKTLIKIESQLQAARRIYNNDVTRYNTKLYTFPNNMVAYLFAFEEMELFGLEGEDEVKVQF